MKRLLVQIGGAGLGDLWQFRMLAHDLKAAHPGHRLVVAIAERHFEALSCHPDIDELVPAHLVGKPWKDAIEPYDYSYTYDLRVPMSMACAKGWNVPDTWEALMGLQVDDRDMKFQLTEDEKDFAADPRPSVAFCPVSSTPVRNLSPKCQKETAQALLDKGWQVVAIHNEHLPHLPPEVIQVPDMTIRQSIALHYAVDYCITTDTSHSHISGGLGKPGVHCYSQQCGHIYTRHYPRANVLQYHPPGTKSTRMDMRNFTSQDIIKAFEEVVVQ